jgi:hypothetical protein
LTLNLRVEHHDDPPLEFGEGEAATPKEGLATFGPYSLRLGAAHRSEVRLGIVGTRESVEATNRMLDRIERGALSENANQALFPDFPGFEPVFRAKLHRTTDHVIPDAVVSRALSRKPKDAFREVLELWGLPIESMAERELRPDLVLCALPSDVVARCRRIEQRLPRKVADQMRRDAEMRAAGQSSLFDIGADQTLEDAADPAPQDLLYRDLRRALKARAMAARLPIQLLTEHAWQDSQANQDPATRAWNLSVALFYKAGGIPWRARPRTEETCFVGISFHHLWTTTRHLVYSSVAQAFSSDGEGFALRGESIPWDSKTKQPHLPADKARRLLTSVLDAYRDRSGRTPLRLVVHKTSAYTPEERHAIEDALRDVPAVQLLTLRSGDFRLIRQGAYPPHRGTLCEVGDTRFVFTVGYMPQHLTYPGPHVPVPLEVLGANDDFDGVSADLLALTKMNWNSAASFASLPISLSFARKVGGVMAEVPSTDTPHPSFRYYM